jgi:hypothetical protein
VVAWFLGKYFGGIKMRKQAYILIGEGNTGKTTFQRELIYMLNHGWYERLPKNKVIDVTVNVGSKNIQQVFLMNRSYQEYIDEYKNIGNYFKNFFTDTGACIMSSWPVLTDVDNMIAELQKRFFNVCGVFFSNSIEKNKKTNMEISQLKWDEKMVIDNPVVESGDESWKTAIHSGATELCWHLLSR